MVEVAGLKGPKKEQEDTSNSTYYAEANFPQPTSCGHKEARQNLIRGDQQHLKAAPPLPHYRTSGYRTASSHHPL